MHDRGDRLRHRVEQQVDAGASGRQCHDGHAELSVATDLGDDRSAVVRRLTQRALDDAGAEERGDPALWSVGTRRLVDATADVPHTTDEADVLDGEEADAASAVASTSCRKPHGSIVARGRRKLTSQRRWPTPVSSRSPSGAPCDRAAASRN